MLCQMWKGIWWQFCGCDQNKSLPVCEKEPISDYPASQFITGVCTKISYTLANLLRPTIRLITLIILTEQNTGQSMDNWLKLFEENLRLRNLLCFYQGFVISLWLTLNRKCVLHGLNEWVPQAFHHLHLPQFFPHLPVRSRESDTF